MPSKRSFLVAVAGAYVAIGLLAYAGVLGVGFLGDDWFFLDVIARAPNALVSFAVFNDRYTRPIVAFIYYLNYQYFGLWSTPAHVAGVLLHVFNAWLVTLFVLRLSPRPDRLAALGAGGIFLLFAGHSEAVAWPAGLADVALAPFLIATIFATDRALTDQSPGRWMGAVWLLSASAFLAKETALIMPLLTVAFGLTRLDRPDARRRIGVLAVGQFAICAGYWMYRTYRFGSALGAYAGMGTSEGQRIDVARMFVLRSFVPPGRIAAYLWTHHIDVLLLAAGAAALLFLAVRDRDSRRWLAFLCAGLAITLAPVLPLSISLVSTLTERYLYPVTIFSCALTAWAITRLVPGRVPAGLALAAVALLNGFFLQKSNRTWVSEDAVFRSTVEGIRQLAATHGPREQTTFLLLNMPDTIERPFVDGTAVLSALRLGGPTSEASEWHVRIVAMHTGQRAADGRVTRTAANAFSVDVGDNEIVPGWISDTELYFASRVSPHSFTVSIRPFGRRVVVAHWTGGTVRAIAELPQTGEPFGVIDLPSGDVACTGTVRFAGWALDNKPGVTARLEREAADGAWTPIGEAEWKRGTRPDVQAAFGDFPGADRAEWNVTVGCTTLPALPSRMRVVARDADGVEAVLGTRMLSRQ